VLGIFENRAVVLIVSNENKVQNDESKVFNKEISSKYKMKNHK
jgi:hypothetical protein